ncbi:MULTISPECIES: DMT family transporter [Tenacibaculum]|uniref:DMT family transporter n=1 Tax=Tenacibaculum TaxID=104267 RepID=UPI000EAE4677|nr:MULTISPECIES: EamA family transporter [Tenacibaculum]NVK07568.1 EamA family transporter [Tenacibaculum sp.]RLK03017.1 EamA domain-containing membrane protein RarD [Tenacibaculum discolor]
MNSQQQKWLFLIVLSLVWGSSFILMKKALIGLTPIQVGALRMLITAVFLLLVGFKSLKRIEKRHWKYVAYTAVLGTFFPAFLFAFAVSKIDSSIPAILNSLTPFNTFIFGALVFGFTFKRKQFYGVLIGLAGTLILILKGAELNPNQNYWYAVLILIASIGYAFNVNMIKKYLDDLDALAITTGNFLLLIIPAFIVLAFSGFFSTFEVTEETTSALGYITVLAVVGTGIAKVLFNKMVHLSSPVFAASVTYLIPAVAVIWGIVDGEKLSLIQLLAGGIILFGVWLVNKAR